MTTINPEGTELDGFAWLHFVQFKVTGLLMYTSCIYRDAEFTCVRHDVRGKFSIVKEILPSLAVQKIAQNRFYRRYCDIKLR